MMICCAWVDPPSKYFKLERDISYLISLDHLQEACVVDVYLKPGRELYTILILTDYLLPAI